MKISASMGDKTWEFNVSSLYFFHYHICFEICEIGDMVEHEATLANPKLISTLSRSMQESGFLHPILTTEIHGQRVIADGTHRIRVLSQIKEANSYDFLYVPSVNLSKSGFSRESWALIYENNEHNLKNLIQQWDAQPVQSLTTSDILELFTKGYTAAVVRVENQYWIIQMPSQPRHLFLETLKAIDQHLYFPDKFDTISKTLEEKSDFIILAPPIDNLGDINLLLNNPQLRRCKGSRTVLPVRPMYLPIPLMLLSLPKKQVEREIQDIIKHLISERRILLISPGVHNLDFGGGTYDHYLLVFHRDICFKDLDIKQSDNQPMMWEPTIEEKNQS